ncbi:MAG: hypothetical protein ABFC96_14470 [Thermoguttaceae bacterium]
MNRTINDRPRSESALAAGIVRLAAAGTAAWSSAGPACRRPLNVAAMLVLTGLLVICLGVGRCAAQSSVPPAVAPTSGSGAIAPPANWDPYATPSSAPASAPALPGTYSEDLDMPFTQGSTPLAVPAGRRAVVLAGKSKGTESKPLTKEQQEAAALLQKYVGVQELQRSAAQVLRAKAEQLTPKKPDAKEKKADAADDAAKVKAFYGQVVTGDWAAIKSHLAKLPKDAGPAVYTHLLTLMLKGKAFVLPDEILTLADASPRDLDEAQLTALGQLLSQTSEKLGVPKSMLARLEQGTERLGGQDPKNRLTAARLLAGAGMTDRALVYLPPMDEVRRAKDPVLLNLYASCVQTLGERKPGGGGIPQAWELTQMVLDAPKLADAPKAEALRRTIALVPRMPERTIALWVKRRFRQQPELGMAILAEAAQRVESSFSEKSPEPRLMALAAQQRLVESLLADGGRSVPRWVDAVGLMTPGWINEAAYTTGGNDQPGSDAGPIEDEEEPVSSAAARNRMLAQARPNGNEPPRLPSAALLKSAPSEAWCQVLPPDMAAQVRHLTGKLAAEAGDRARTFAAVQSVAGRDPAAAKELVERYLAAWSSRLNSSVDSSGGTRIINRYIGGRFVSYTVSSPIYYGYNRSGGSVPLIRARQVRNLAELAKLLKEVAALDSPPPDNTAIISALDACHSPAEVYREEDLKQVFGDVGMLRPEMTLQLVSAMRTRLGGQWRKPEVQEQADTKRTDKEQVAEVLRGYELAKRLLAPVLAKASHQPEPVLLDATLAFDLAEFLYGQNADLKRYTTARNRAFASYRKAARLYAESLPEMPDQQQSIEVYRQWFQSTLGASDLAYLTRQDRPDVDEIGRVAAAIRGLGGRATDRHLRMFAEAAISSMDQLPPHLKPHFLRQTMRVVGDHPAGKKARQRLQFYDDLLGEAQLNLAVDGDANVGHGQPFGVRLSIRYTNALGRESDGFSRLLQKTYSQLSYREIDYPKDIERSLTEKLSQAFEVQTVRFHDSKVAPRGFGRTGWRETPLAYLVLKAKTPAVDRIPSMAIDLEFNDGNGIVLLPITSQVVLVDARQAKPPMRPVSDLKVRQVLDDRRLDAGAAQVEVVATGNGLIPSLDRLLQVGDKAIPGFRIAKTQDQGLELKSLDSAGDQTHPVCERRWALELTPMPDAPTSTFVYPKAAESSPAMSYQRYSDADIVDVAAVVPLRGGPLLTRHWLLIVVGVAIAAFVAVVAAIAYRRIGRRRNASAAGPSYRCPDPLTPFTLLELLRRIHLDESLPLAAEGRHTLGATIDDFERQFFGRTPEPAVAVDLAAVADRWLAAAKGGHKTAR